MTGPVAVLGMGALGAAMARRLAAQGFTVRVWNRTKAKAEPLADDGAQVCGSVEEAARGAEVLLTVLSNGDVVASAAQEALPALADGAVWVQSATVGVQANQRLASMADEHAVAYFDVPVSGGGPDAEAGRLAILASGPEEHRDRAQPVFDALGRGTVWAGEAGAGSRLKLVVNTYLLTVLEGMAESVALAEGLEIDPDLLLQVLAGGPLEMPYAQAKGRSMIDRDYTTHSVLDLGGKDMRLAREAAESAGVDVPLPGLIAARIARAEAAGYGDADQACLVEVARARLEDAGDG